MSKPTNVVQKFSHLIEQGQRLSHDQIANQSLGMMQMLAANPEQRASWRSLKEALEMIYHSLERDEQALTAQALDTKIVHCLQRITR